MTFSGTANSNQRNPYVFVVGCPRSGTTLLQRMLDSHPDLSVATDTHFITRMIEGDTQINPEMTPELTERIIQYHRFSRLGLPADSVRMMARQAKYYTDFISAVYSEYARIRNKSLGGEKTPDYVMHLSTLHQLF